MIGVEVASPPPRQHETSSKRQSLKPQTPEKDLPVRSGPQNCLCPVMALVERCPWFPGTWAFCSWERSWERCANPHFRTTSINFVPRNFRELLLSAVWGHANKFCSQELFGIVPRNFSKCSQEQFPGIVPDELWCINLGQGHSKGIVVLPEMSGLRY